MEDIENLFCPICGEPTRVYMGNARKDRLCAKHANELKAGKIVQCEKCNAWKDIDTPCKCEEKKVFTELPTEGFDKCIGCGVETEGYAFCKECWKKYSSDEMLKMLNGEIIESNNLKETTKENDIQNEKNSSISINGNNKSKCIICGKETDGLLFCPSCYCKYKDKELLFKITNCSNVELLDADYEGRYTCKDGHIVKSKSERDIDNYLFENGIQHGYEKELSYGPNDNEILHPDFYLPHYLGAGKHVYIEHWGYNENNIQYTKTKKFKMPIYEKLCKETNITLVCTYEKSDTGKIDTALDRKLNKLYLKENEINYKE